MGARRATGAATVRDFNLGEYGKEVSWTTERATGARIGANGMMGLTPKRKEGQTRRHNKRHSKEKAAEPGCLDR